MEEVWRKERDAWHRQKEDLKVLAPHQIYESLFKISSLLSFKFAPSVDAENIFILLKHPQNAEFVLLSYL